MLENQQGWRYSGCWLTFSDIVSEGVIPDEIKNDANAWAGCIAGALEQQEYPRRIEKAGFADLQILSSREFYMEDKVGQTQEKLFSITVKAHK